jgi:hypothetical protein
LDYLLIATILLFLPGLAICYLVGLDKYRYLLSFSLSYAVFVLLLKSIFLLGLDAQSFTYTYFLVIFTLVLLASIKYYRHRYNKYNNANICEVICYGCNGFAKLAPVLIVFPIAIYFYLVGAYTDLPSDTFQHLEYMQEITHKMLRPEKYSHLLNLYLGQNGKYWYYLYSFITLWGGSTIQASITPASFFNTTVFLLGVFWFSQVVFRDMHGSVKLLGFTSIVTVFFTFSHFGINIFSFTRYYALAPVILNFVLYFSVMAIVIDFFREKTWGIKYLAVAGIIFYVSLHIHRQEAVFAVLMVCIMSFYLFVQNHMPSLRRLWEGQGRSIHISTKKFFTDKVNVSFLLTQTAMVSLFFYSYFSISRHKVTVPKVISLENILPFFKNLYILNPGFQFYNVVTVWGVAVILLFILNIKKFRNNAFLMAGMLSPFFTVFNPFFTDLFLRHTRGDLLWRLTFLIPLHLVAAYLFVTAVQYIWTGSYLKKAYGAVSVIILVTLLFPFKTTFLENTYSRLLTLKPVPVENSSEYWGDLIEYLNGIDDKKKVITDRVTGYMVTALTRHISPRVKFHRKLNGYIEFNFDDYSSHPFDRYKGCLFIINKRNGGMSKTGRVARHWPEKILQVDSYYSSDKLEEYVSSNPDRFKLLWEENKVRVYLLDSPEK